MLVRFRLGWKFLNEVDHSMGTAVRLQWKVGNLIFHQYKFFQILDFRTTN